MMTRRAPARVGCYAPAWNRVHTSTSAFDRMRRSERTRSCQTNPAEQAAPQRDRTHGRRHPDEPGVRGRTTARARQTNPPERANPRRERTQDAGIQTNPAVRERTRQLAKRTQRSGRIRGANEPTGAGIPTNRPCASKRTQRRANPNEPEDVIASRASRPRRQAGSLGAVGDAERARALEEPAGAGREHDAAEVNQHDDQEHDGGELEPRRRA
jgi:hypothetical protein